MHDISMLRARTMDRARHTGRWARASSRCVAFAILCLSALSCGPTVPRSVGPTVVSSTPSVRPIVLPPTAASPVWLGLSFSRISDHSIAAKLDSADRPGVTAIELRNLRSQTITAATLDTSAADSARSVFVLPTPWHGELRIRPPASNGGDDHAESMFVAVVLEPLLSGAAGTPPRIIYGPSGRVSVRFAEHTRASPGTQIVITSPAISTPVPPAGLVDDPVEIGFIPPSPTATTAVVGLTPWSPPATAKLSLNVFDPTTKTWTALPSHVGRDGTVFASGALPGVYALTVGP